MKKTMIVGLMTVLLGAVVAGAVERPGTLLSTMKTEQVVNQDQIVKAVDSYVADIQKEKGSFMLKDDKTDQQLTLTQDKIRKDDAAMLSKDKYFVPGVFKSADGKSYEIDFILKHTLIGKELKVSDAYIHKVDGVERYQWMQDKDDWKREPVNPM